MQEHGGTVGSGYQSDLAYIHDAGFTAFARESAPGLLKILQTAGIDEGRVVDLGCGSGVWARELVKAGYDALGVDLSPAFIEIARKRVPSAEFHAASFLDFPLPRCRAVTAIGEVFNYQFDRRNHWKTLQRFFKKVYAALEPGGVFLFDSAEPGRNQDVAQSFRHSGDWTVLVDFEHDPAKRTLTRRVVTYRKVGKCFRRDEETHILRLYPGRELAELLREIGFRVRLLRRYGDFPLPPGIVGIVARKA